MQRASFVVALHIQFAIERHFHVKNAEIQRATETGAKDAYDGMQINVNKFISFVGIKSILDSI